MHPLMGDGTAASGCSDLGAQSTNAAPSNSGSRRPQHCSSPSTLLNHGAGQHRRHIVAGHRRLPNELYWETTKWVRLQHYFRIRENEGAKVFLIGTFGAYLQQHCQKLNTILQKLPYMQRIWYRLLGPDGSPYYGTVPSSVFLSIESNVDDFKAAVYNKEFALLHSVTPSMLNIYSNNATIELLSPYSYIWSRGATFDKAILVVVVNAPSASSFNSPFGSTSQAVSREEMVQRVKPFIYYDAFDEEYMMNCVTPINSTMAITFKHGSHENIILGQRLKIMNEMNPDPPVDVICTHISPTRDFILYSRIEGEFRHPIYETEIREGQTYILCGFPKGHPTSQSVSGYVSAARCSFSAYLIGHGGAVKGYSGGPAFCERTGRLIAMNVVGDWGNVAESTINKMIPINSVISDVLSADKEYLEWTGPRYAAKKAEIVKFLTEYCSLTGEQANEMAFALLERGIPMQLIRMKLNEFVGHVLDWCKIEQYKEKILAGMGRLISEGINNPGGTASSSQSGSAAPARTE